MRETSRKTDRRSRKTDRRSTDFVIHFMFSGSARAPLYRSTYSAIGYLTRERAMARAYLLYAFAATVDVDATITILRRDKRSPGVAPDVELVERLTYKSTLDEPR